MKVAILTTDNREYFEDYESPTPSFAAAPAALLQGLEMFPDVAIHVVSCSQRRLKAPEKIAPNIWFHSLHVPKIGWLRTGYQGCIRAVRRRLAHIRPDIVHGQGTERDCAMSAALSDFPNVVTIHGNMAELARLFGARVGSYGWLTARLENFTLRRTSGVFCNSNYTQALIRPRAKRTWRVPNALRSAFFDTVPSYSPGSRPCILLCVGAVVPRKRQLELLEAVQDLWQQGTKSEFHFIGKANPSDAYAAKFLDRLKSLGAHGRARHFPHLSTSALIQRFDEASGLVHFPSEEAFGLVVAEGLARELKFFGARLGGINDIAEGVPGAELFDRDDWKTLNDSVARWISQGCLRPRGPAAIMRERYHPQIIARRHLEIYREVLQTSS